MPPQNIAHLLKLQQQGSIQARLHLAQKYSKCPQELHEDDLEGIFLTLQDCYDNKQWRLVLDFVLSLCNLFEQQGRWQEGISCQCWALEATDALGDIKSRAYLFFNLGLLYDRQGLLSEAKQHYQASADLAEELGQTTILADAKHRLGWIAHSRHEFDRARTLYLEAKSLRESLRPPDPLAISRSWHQLGILEQDLDNHELAQVYYEKALALRQGQNAEFLIAASLHQLGALAAARKKWDQATAYFTETLSIRRKLRDRAGEAQALDYLGVIAQQQRQWETARKHYSSSHRLKKELGDTTGLLRAEIHLGEVCLAQQDWATAQSWFEDCLEKSRALNEHYFEAQAHLKLGQLFFQTPDFEAATAHYQLSAKLLEQLDGTWNERAGVLYQLGLIAHNQGQLQVAQNYYQASLAIQEEKGFILDAAKTHLQLGMLYQAQDFYIAAQQHYEASRIIFEKEGVVSLLAQAIYRLGNITELHRQPDRAYTYYQQTEELCRSHSLPLMKGLQAAKERVGGKR